MHLPNRRGQSIYSRDVRWENQASLTGNTRPLNSFGLEQNVHLQAFHLVASCKSLPLQEVVEE